MLHVLITGGTGLIGSALCDFLLDEGYGVGVLTRDPGKLAAHAKLRPYHWDPARGIVDERALREADLIVHLAGDPVAGGRWTEEKKRSLVASRVDTIRLLRERLDKVPHRLQALVSASGVSYYGERGDALLGEAEPAGAGFLAGLCQDWEREALAFGERGIRVAVLRTGLVMAPGAPALAPLAKALRFGLAPVPGTGETWLSWIHLRDLVRLYGCALSEPDFTGPFNAVSPFPVKTRQLTDALARVLKGGFAVPVYFPSLLIRAFGGEKATEMLKSTRVSAAKVLDRGFEFSFPTLGGALEEVCGRRSGER